MHLIEIHIRDLDQLFNSMDPTPFRHKDIDPEAEEFIVSWAREHPIDSELSLIIHLDHPPITSDAEKAAIEEIQNYFSYRASMVNREFGQLMRRGRISLIIGLAFLALCLLIAHMISNIGGSYAPVVLVKDSLTIGG